MHNTVLCIVNAYDLTQHFFIQTLINKPLFGLLQVIVTFTTRNGKDVLCSCKEQAYELLRCVHIS